jgi:hypothetical protein
MRRLGSDVALILALRRLGADITVTVEPPDDAS